VQELGETALHKAARRGRTEIVNALLKAPRIAVNLKNVRDLLLQHPPIHVSFASINGVRISISLRLLASRASSLCDM
jgi:ankyrin repeat protein